MTARDKIDAITKAITAYPDMQIGQLLFVAAQKGGGRSIHACPDEALLCGLEEMFNDVLEARDSPLPGGTPCEASEEPFVCSWLGVKVGERFRIRGFNSATFWVLDDGTFYTSPENVVGSSVAFLAAIENPTIVIRLPALTERDVADAEAAKRFWKDAETVTRYQLPTTDGYSVKVESRVRTLGWLHKDSFPSVEVGETYRLDDIIAGGSTS